MESACHTLIVMVIMLHFSNIEVTFFLPPLNPGFACMFFLGVIFRFDLDFGPMSIHFEGSRTSLSLDW